MQRMQWMTLLALLGAAGAAFGQDTPPVRYRLDQAHRPEKVSEIGGEWTVDNVRRSPYDPLDPDLAPYRGYRGVW